MADVVNGQIAELIGEPCGATAGKSSILCGWTRGAIEIAMGACTAQTGTVALWVQLDDTLALEKASTSQYLFGYILDGGNRIALYTIESEIDGRQVHKLALGLGDALTREENIATLWPDQLYHIVLTWDHGTYAVYVDGLKIVSDSYTGLDSLHAFPDAEPEGFPALICPECGGSFRCDTSEPVKCSRQHPDYTT